MFTNSAENFFCEVWDLEDVKWTIKYSEYGRYETVKAGDAFAIPADFKGTWESISHAQKFYAIYEDAE